MTQHIKVIRSGRRTVALEVTRALEVLVRAPFHMSDDDIRKFVAEHEGWIDKHLEIMQSRLLAEESQANEPPFTEAEVRELARQALEFLPERVAYFASIMGVSYGTITVRNQLTRWGSCSSRGNLSFNCVLALCPREVADYVIIHELCHRIHMNHSPAFWQQVEKYCPDYKAHRAYLKNSNLVNRLRVRV